MMVVGGKRAISDIQFHWNRTFIRLGNRNLQIEFSRLLQLLYLCTNQVRRRGRDSPALVPSVHCEICFYSDCVLAFVRISTKSNFILLRLYGEMFYIN